MELAYRTTIVLARTAMRAVDLRVHLIGAGHVPSTGPAVLVANHVSFLDFLLVGLAARPSGRCPRFLSRHEVWRHQVVGRFMTAMRHVPVDRAAPAAAYLRARTLLRDGEVVAVFPEAGISTSYTVRALMPGAVALAADTGAPVVPIALWGGQRLATAHRPVELRRGRPVTIRVGAPYAVAPDADPSGATRDLGALLQGMLTGLQRLPEHQPAPGERAEWHPAHLGGAAPTPAQARAVETTAHPHAVRATWAPGQPPRLAGMPAEESPPRRQRIAAYALLQRGDAVLLTRMSSRTRIPGRWTLPGGGIDHGEDPKEALVREVYEETGLHIQPGLVVDVHSSHFTGPRADGVVEDYHGIHLIFVAQVLPESEGVDPHVTEQDGSTDLARWVPREEALGLDLLSAARHALTEPRVAG